MLEIIREKLKETKDEQSTIDLLSEVDESIGQYLEEANELIVAIQDKSLGFVERERDNVPVDDLPPAAVELENEIRGRAKAVAKKVAKKKRKKKKNSGLA